MKDTRYQVATAEKLHELIEQRDLEGVAKLLGFKVEAFGDRRDLIEKVNESLKSYTINNRYLSYPTHA